MRIIKNMMTILIVFCISIMIFSSSVDAAVASVSRSSSKVTVGSDVSVTVSFSEKVSAAQFKLTYDSSKFTFVSSSTEGYDAGSNMFAWVSLTDTASLGSVTFKFKGKATGTGTFNLSGLVLSKNSGTASIGTSSTSVTVENAKTNTNTNTGTKKPTTNTNQNTTPETPTVEQVLKPELDNVKIELAQLIESDYTEASWKSLTDLIARAEAVTTNSEYDEIKAGLTTDSLITAEFEKEEILNLLMKLVGVNQKDYTEESWNELQSAIETAQNAKLKSEYDKIKDKVTLDTLVKKGGVKEFFQNFIQGLERRETVYLAFAGTVLVLLLIILILSILLCKAKRKNRMDIPARRMK